MAAVEPSSSPSYMSFTRAQWATLRANTPLLLDEDELRRLRGVNEPMPVDEVAEIYLPLSRLINLHVEAARDLLQVTDRFLGRPSQPPPFVVAIAGSVAAGKSTTARVLRALLARWPSHPKVELVTTDGFLHPNAVLEARGLMHRKGFPESYDVARLLRFLTDLKAGKPTVEAPVYSHLVYDIVPDERKTVRRPDVLILEGINVLQAPTAAARDEADGRPRLMVSDFIDFSIYVDADEAALEQWYVRRFLSLRDTAFRDPASYFHRYAALSEPEAIETAQRIWRDINWLNLKQNIEGTRERASVILRKGAEHAVEEVRLRRAPIVPAKLRRAK
ncbi:type I pantothenate kinase [Roseisolibacter agri]|uniref:type I pantothenate kinase n=1 Tax=Roseisolibacter agri TaxID=2014610 RepID=UPI003CE4ECC6